MVKLTKEERDRKIFPLDLLFANRKDCDDKTEKYIKDLLFIASTDLISAIKLYDIQLYPQAIYLLQQSFEKIAKSEYLKDNTITLNSLRSKVGHQTDVLQYLSVANIFRKMKNCPNSCGKNVNTEENVRYFEERAKQHKKSASALSQIYMLSKHHVTYWLKVLDSHSSKNKAYSSKWILKEIFTNISPIHVPYFLGPEIDSLSKILSPYCEVTRYPDEKFNPLELDKEKEIIKNFYKIAVALLRLFVLIDPTLTLKFIKKGFYNKKILKELEKCLGGNVINRVKTLDILPNIAKHKS